MLDSGEKPQSLEALLKIIAEKRRALMEYSDKHGRINVKMLDGLVKLEAWRDFLVGKWIENQKMYSPNEC